MGTQYYEVYGSRSVFLGVVYDWQKVLGKKNHDLRKVIYHLNISKQRHRGKKRSYRPRLHITSSVVDEETENTKNVRSRPLLLKEL